MQQCTQFFSRAYNRIADDDYSDSADIHEEHHPSAVGKITEHHRQMSCRVIQNFEDRILMALCDLKGPFTVDGLSASDSFSKANTIRDRSTEKINGLRCWMRRASGLFPKIHPSQTETVII
jgi:hypothetical protein